MHARKHKQRARQAAAVLQKIHNPQHTVVSMGQSLEGPSSNQKVAGSPRGYARDHGEVSLYPELLLHFSRTLSNIKGER